MKGHGRPEPAFYVAGAALALVVGWLLFEVLRMLGWLAIWIVEGG